MQRRNSLIPPALFALAFVGALVALKGGAVLRARLPARPPAAAPAPLKGRPAALAAAPVAVGPRDLAREPSPPQTQTSDVPRAASAPDSIEAAVDMSVRESLRLASADEDQDVAARTQEEYEALVEREDD